MMSLVLAVLLLPQASGLTDAAAITREVRRAVEAGTDARSEQTWQAALARRPSDRRALLALATLARLRYRYEKADTLYQRVLQGSATADDYSAAARLGMALWRSLGLDIAGADSLFVHARTEALAASDSRVGFDAAMSLSQIRSRTAGPKVGLQLAREAAALLRAPPAEDSAQILCSEGGLLEQLGDTSGYTRVRSGIRVAERSRSPRVQASCEMLAAQIAERRGYAAAASGEAARAVRHYEQVHYLLGVALASQWLGYTRFLRGYFSDSRADLERAVRAAQITRFETVEAWARAGLAELFLALGDGEAARAQATLAAALHAAHGDLWGLATARRFEGLVLESHGRVGEARAKYVESIAAFRRAGLSYNALDVMRLLALAEMRAGGSLDSAQRVLDEATRLARTSANSGWMSELPLHLSRLAMVRGDLRLADSILATARPRYDWRKDSTDLFKMEFAVQEAELALRQQRVAVAESAVTSVATTLAWMRGKMTHDDLRAGLAQLRRGWESLGEAYPGLVAGLVAGRRIPTAFRFIESVRGRELTEGLLRSIARMTDSSLAFRAFRRVAASTRVASIDDVQRQLQADEALVSLTLGLAGAPTTAIVVTKDTSFALSLAARDVVAPLIERYQRIAATGTEPVDIGRQLGAALLTPLARALPSSISRLLISPDGELFRVPFDALRLADDRYAVERFAISLVPSATVALALRALPVPSNATRLIAVGDPAFARERPVSQPATAYPARAIDSTRFGNVTLARLPRSADEARRVAQYGIRGEVWTRRDASESRVRTADWRTVGVAHFATHALIDAEGQERSALALAPSAGDDGYLTTSEIATLRFNASLVVLSACQTLGGQVLGGEGLRGLAGPLFEAGARAIVVTHWSIGDRSVLPFVDRFYAAMGAGESVSDALRHTKLTAIRDGARISDWAAFTVIGDASMRPALRPRRLSPVDWLRDLLQPMRDTTGA